MQSLTILHTPHRLLTKNLETSESYAKVSRIAAAESCTFATLGELQRVLAKLAKQRDKCAIRGQLKPDAPLPLKRRLTHFDDAPQAWVMLDIDNIMSATSLGARTSYTDEQAEFARSRLPDPFKTAACVWQASASAGTSAKLKLHLWFLLDAPLTAAQLRVWLRDCAVIDKSVLRAVQPLYTADPIRGPYVGARLGKLKGSKRVATPTDLAVVEAAPTPAELPARQPGAADVSDALVESQTKKAIAAARAVLNSCTVAYTDAYTAGTHLGVAVALQTWNADSQWLPEAERLARKWGKRFAALEGTNQPTETYVARVLEGIAWAVAQERQRLQGKSQAVLDGMRKSLEGECARLLSRMGKNAGNERVLKEVGAKLGKYRETHPEAVDTFIKSSGFSQAQALEALSVAVPVNLDSWREGLLMLKDEIQATDDNILAVFEQYPGFLDSFELNVRSRFLEATEDNILGLPAGVVDIESVARRLVRWLSSLGMRKMALHRVLTLFKATQQLFKTYDPFLRLFPEAEYEKPEAVQALAALKPRLDNWLHRHFGAAGEDSYVRAVAAKTLIAAVARAVKPGAQVDTMLVLVGEQGIGKTSALRTLGTVFDGGYTELLSMQDKDSILGMHKSIVVEVSELRALRSSQEEVSKAFFTRKWDRLRAPYAREAEEMHRRMVFIGTTNDDDFLSDRANRRYWPVHCTDICTLTKKQALALWREAALRYATGESWWLNQDETAHQVLAAAGVRAENLIESVLKVWLKGRTEFSLLDAVKAVYPDATDFPKQGQGVARALRALGCQSVHTKKKRYWVRG